MDGFAEKRPGEDMLGPDAKRPRGTPSAVVHCRNLPSDCTEADMYALGMPFGRVVAVLMLKGKTQGFIEMEDIAAATNLVNCYQAAPPVIRKRPVYVQFSQHQKLNSATPAQAVASAGITPYQHNPLEAAEGVGTIVHAEVSNMVYPVTLDTMYQVFSKFGAIVRIVTFVKNDKFQCLAQFHDNMAASSARMALDGQNIYSGCCTLRCTFSKLGNLTVKYNNERSWDFTNPNLPANEPAGPSGQLGMPTYAGGHPMGMGMVPQPMAMGIGAAGGLGHQVSRLPGCVLIISNLPPTITVDQLFTLVGVYADVERVRIMFNKQDTALVQTRDPAQAQLAIANLNGVRVFGHELRVALSKHNEVAGASKNDNAGERLLSRDYTNSLLHRFRVIGSKNYQNICAPNAVLHVSNLGPHVDEDAVRRIFEAYGTVHMVRFLPCKNQNREATATATEAQTQTQTQTRRMALVRMDTVEAAVGALVYTHSTEHYGLSLRVSFAKNHDAQ